VLVDVVARGEAVEKDLDAMIRRRDDKRRQTEGERREEELWAQSCRAHNAQREQERRAAWASFHRAQAERHRATLTDLVVFHEAQAEKYAEKNNGHHEEDSCSARKAG
jgi:hypothetical protein